MNVFGKKEVFAVEFHQEERMAPRVFGGVLVWIENRYIGGVECTGFLWIVSMTLLDVFIKREKVSIPKSSFVGWSKEEIHEYFYQNLENDDTSAEFYKYLFSMGEIDDEFSTFIYFDVETDAFHFIWKYRSGSHEYYKDHVGEVFAAKVSHRELYEVIILVNKYGNENDWS